MNRFLPLLRLCAACLLAFASALAPAWAASQVFVATMRAPVGSTDAGGHLYRVDLRTHTSTFIGRVLVDGTQPVGLSGMAFHPRTNVLYGITVGVNDAKRAALLTIDPATAEARVVGRLSRPLTDISFDRNGRLFGWTANTGQLAWVDVQTAKVTPIGEASAPVGGAFAIDTRGNAFVATWAPPGTIDRVNLDEGRVAQGPAVSNLPDVATLRSMAFSERDELYATLSVRSTRANSSLLRIDPATGNASAVGEIPEDSEAIAVPWGSDVVRTEDMLRWLACGAIVLMVATVGWLTLSPQRRRPLL